MPGKLFALPALLLLLGVAGCNSDKSDFVHKTEQELAGMELQNQQANAAFRNSDYESAGKILMQLSSEMTVSRPQYQMELLSVLLLEGKHDEAHQLMMKLHQDIEALFDVKLEEKAQSLWHGEVNKVYKGDAYERSTFYALLALSFIRQENYADALRSVKNGLLAEADANNQKSIDDYGLLHYLGYVACSRMNDTAAADEFLRAMYNGLEPRGFELEDPNGNRNIDHCFEQLKKSDHNVFLVIWTGAPPEVVCTGQYKEKRSIVRGRNAFDMMTIAVSSSPPVTIPNNLGDLNYQATTRGGRLMDDVLADQAAAKTAMNVGGNVFMIAGSALVIAGARSMGAPPVGVSLLGAGVGCWVVGGGCYVVGSLMNPAADPRFWRNIPCQFYIVPLRLEPGQHQIMLTGYNHFDVVGASYYNIHVPADQKNQVIHLSMMQPETTAQNVRSSKILVELESVLDKAEQNRMQKEIK